MLSAGSLAPPGTLVGGGYEVRRLVGEGGMGAVFEVGRQGETFALKVLHGDQPKPEFVARFLREAEVSASLRGPNLVPVVDMGFDGRLNRLFLVMPLLRGRDLEQQLERGPLHPTVAVRLVAQAAAGLIILHGGGVIHRDIKPANIFLDITDGVVTAKVNDLGLAKLIADSSKGLTATGATLGTPLFMSPEQLADAKHVDARADLWSLGLTLYQALTGVNPFSSCRTFIELATRLMSEDVPFLQDHAPWVDPALASLVHGTLLRDVSERCPSASEFLEALSAFVGGTIEVTEAMLQPAGEELRSSRAVTGAKPRSWATRVRPTSLVKVNDPRIGQVVGRKYKLRKLLGQGGMGSVYEADGPSGVAAVKVMTTQHAHDEGALRRFVREARSAMAVKSPHVVAVLDADTDASQGAPYIAMELLRGEDLDALVHRVGPLEPKVAARLFVEACEGLEAAHRLGLVHRDIKPANLFLHQEGQQITVKICDFGVAKSTAPTDGQPATVNLTRTGGILGSPIYMSPEQAQNAKDIDARTDLWSLSASLYQVLSGVPPWQGLESLGEVLVAICTKDFKPMQDVAPWVDAELAAIVHRGLQKDVSARWGSTTELKAALEAYAGGQTVSRASLEGISGQTRSTVAPRYTPGMARTADAVATSQAPRAAGRGPLLVGLAGVVMALTVGGAWVSKGASTPAAPSLPAAVAPSSSTPVAAAKVQARVTVSPRDARVAVGDRPTFLGPGGVLLLEGEVGEALEVAVEAGGQLVKQTVTLVAAGQAEPGTIEVTPPPASSSAPSKAMGAPGGKPVVARPTLDKPAAEKPPERPAEKPTPTALPTRF